MNYWERRAIENREMTDLIESNSMVRLNLLLKKALKEISEEIDEFNLAYADEFLTVKEKQELMRQLKKAASYEQRDKILQQLYTEKAKLYKLNRLEGLQISLQIRLSELTSSSEKEIATTLSKVGASAYKFASETFTKRYAIDLSSISKATIKTLADQTWVGKTNWSARIWKDRNKLGKVLDKTLTSGIAKGLPLDVMARDIRDRFQTNTYNAMRLIRTETTHVHEQAIFRIYKETNTKYFKFAATIDSSTSKICREHNNKTYRVEDAKVGVNVPPMHPNCRSTTYPVANTKYLYEKYGLTKD